MKEKIDRKFVLKTEYILTEHEIEKILHNYFNFNTTATVNYEFNCGQCFNDVTITVIEEETVKDEREVPLQNNP